MLVEFFGIKDDGDRVSLGRVESIDNTVIFHDLHEDIKEDLYDFGVFQNGEKYYPKDGETFVKRLPLEFRGSRLRAEMIEEGGD